MRRNSFILTLLATLLLLGSVAHAQGTEPTTVTIALTDDPPSGDPHKTRGANGGHLLFNLFDGLVALSGDMTTIMPALATSWEQVDDLTWSFTLREGVKFHNGEPFTAAAVQYSITRILDPNAVRFNTDYKQIGEVDVVDDYHVIIHTKVPDPNFIAKMAGLHIVPPVYTASVSEEEFGSHPIGTGPYHLVEWTLGQRLVLEANDDYWNGRPTVDRLVFRPIPEASTRLAELQAGTVDLIVGLNYDAIPLLDADPNLRVEANTGRRTVIMHMDLLNGAKPLQDVRVRQAMSYAIDRQLLIDSVLNGYGTPLATIFRPDMAGYSADFQPYPYDPERARELLAEAGYPDGFSIRFMTSDGIVTKGVEVAEALGAMLGDVGIKVDVLPVALQVMRDMYIGNPEPASGKVEPLFMFNYGAPTPDATSPLKALVQTGGIEAFYNDPTMNALIDEYASEMNPTTRASVAHDIQEKLYNDLPIIALYLQLDTYGVSERLNWTARKDEYVLGKDISIR
ncbi:MAG TPA: ABC transporter substrate-binding protein [Trueperaceae bacterium]|nr:ABC transporter substrate-binding protein [Trueperaceae bacterium]